MKRILLLCLLTLISFSFQAQSTRVFQDEIRLPHTSLKDQQSSGTCWSFASTSFIESEAIRLGKDSISISPMFYVHPTYLSKAEKFIETQGGTYFDAGDLTFSVLRGLNEVGAIPLTVYEGKLEEDWQHDHLEMDNLLYEMVKSIGTSGYGRIKPNSWKNSIRAVLDSYLGRVPNSFIYKGVQYTPRSFAKQNLGIDVTKYMEVTSYLQLPFYRYNVLRIPANWGDGKYLNIPLKDFETIIDHALDNGYTLAWDGDVSEDHFDMDSGVLLGTSEEEDQIVTQEWRQEQFISGATTDDHNMHIIGRAKDNAGKIFYIMKNSEGTNSMNGYVYMSKNALLLKTISVLVNSTAIPKEIANKINVNE